jgi:hypothetical protein
VVVQLHQHLLLARLDLVQLCRGPVPDFAGPPGQVGQRGIAAGDDIGNLAAGRRVLLDERVLAAATLDNRGVEVGAGGGQPLQRLGGGRRRPTGTAARRAGGGHDVGPPGVTAPDALGGTRRGTVCLLGETTPAPRRFRSPAPSTRTPAAHT